MTKLLAKKQGRWSTPLLGFSDILALGASYLLARLIVPLAKGTDVLILGEDPTTKYHALFFLSLIVAAAGWAWFKGQYSRRRPFFDDLRGVIYLICFCALIDFSTHFLVKWQVSRLATALTWLIALFLLPSLRVVAKRIALRLGWWQRNIFIIGTDENAQELARALEDESLMGLHVVGFGTIEVDARQQIELNHRSIPLFNVASAARQAVAQTGATEIVVSLSEDQAGEALALAMRLNREIPAVYVSPLLKGVPMYGTELNYFIGHDVLMLRLRNNLLRRAPRVVKRTFDFFGAMAICLAISPVLIALYLMIRKSGGAAIYGHKRVGLGGKHFYCLKFRTMVPNADKVLTEILTSDPVAKMEWDKEFKLKNDPRVTPIGKFLRKTSLDELPQLWNVIKGEMSLVGPRPIVDAELSRYGDDVYYYLAARPGMTGLWQVSGRNDVDYARRVHLDTWYIKNWSLWKDVSILISTVRVVLFRGGAY